MNIAIKGSIRVAALAAASLLSGGTLASAQTCPISPSYSPDFTANQSCLALNPASSAYPLFTPPQTTQPNVANVLRLTPAQGSLAASAWYNSPQVVANGFSTTFAFQVGNSSSYDADGFAFVIQNSSAGVLALGPGGCGIGFGGSTSGCASSTGIPNSVAIEFNTYPNGTGVDPGTEDVSIQNCGGISPNLVDSSCSLKSNDLTGKVNLADGAVHVATVTYTPSTLTNCGTGTQTCSTLDVVLDGTDLFPGGVPFDITTIGLTSSSAFVGFTAGTGGGNDDQDIVSWTFTPTAQSQTGTITPQQTTPTTFNFNGGFAVNDPTSGYDFNAQQTTTNQSLQMVVTALPVSQSACNSLVRVNPLFPTAQCFVYQNGGGQGNDTAVMFEVTCPPTGSCGSSSNPFDAELGTNFSFDCLENVPLQCGPPESSTLSFGLPNLTSLNGLPSVGFLKGEGPDAIHPCTPYLNGTPLFASNQIDYFSLGDTSGGAKGGSGGTTSCWVMTYQTQNELPTVTITQPVSGGTYTLGQSDNSTLANYSCAAVNAGATSPTGPYLTVATCAATDTPGSAVSNGSQFDTSTVGTHTFTVQVEDSATNSSQQSITYSVVPPAQPPAISGVSGATFAVGTRGSVVISATGYPVPSFTEIGALPAGFTLLDNRNGTATLAGTATTSGIFPITITASNGVGLPATLPFTLTVTAGTPAAGKCNGVYNGTFKGNLTVSSGQTCIFVGGGVTGNVSENGGNLQFTNAALGGNVQVSGGAFSVGPGASVKGNFTVLELAKSTVTSQVCGSSIGGNLSILTSSIPVNIGSGSPSCAGNNISGTVTVTANNAPIAIYNNTIGGSLLDVGNLKLTQVFSNHIKAILSCLVNSSITGGSNTAALKQGQCAKF